MELTQQPTKKNEQCPKKKGEKRRKKKKRKEKGHRRRYESPRTRLLGEGKHLTGNFMTCNCYVNKETKKPITLM